MTSTGLSAPEDLLSDVAKRGLTVDPTWGFDPERILPLDLMPPALRELSERLGMTPLQALRSRSTQLGRMRELGIRVVTGMDSGAAPAKPHGSLWRAVAQLESAGYSRAEVLATATSVAADDCGLGATTGRLAAGLDADLLVVDGDLSADVTALSRPLEVRVRGTLADPAEVHAPER
jgi:imidazolonepropionase-like amidohydrolase